MHTHTVLGQRRSPSRPAGTRDAAFHRRHLLVRTAPARLANLSNLRVAERYGRSEHGIMLSVEQLLNPLDTRPHRERAVKFDVAVEIPGYFGGHRAIAAPIKPWGPGAGSPALYADIRPG